MSEEKEIIQIRIRDLRREKALTQEELASALGLSRQSINAMEAGRCLPSLPVALQIASFFSVPLTAVFEMPQEVEEISLISSNEEDSMAQLIPWSPLREMREALDEIMDESVQWQNTSQATTPAANISQTDKEVRVQLALPGYQKDQLSIEVGEDFLSIAGDAREESTDDQFFRREFAHRSFRRSLSLPALVKVDEADAEMKHGILTITLQKLIEEKPKTARIQIKSEE